MDSRYQLLQIFIIFTKTISGDDSVARYNLKFVKPLTSVAIVAALMASSLGVPTTNAKAASQSNVIVSKGKLISKSTGKLVKGIRIYKGKVYKDGILLTGLYKSIYYKAGLKATGWFGTGSNRKYYEKGKPLTGFNKTTNDLYIKGKLATATWYGEGKNRKWYEKGKSTEPGLNKSKRSINHQ